MASAILLKRLSKCGSLCPHSDLAVFFGVGRLVAAFLEIDLSPAVGDRLTNPFDSYGLPSNDRFP